MLVSSVPAWVVYIGHGTYDGRQARLNLRGPDITAEELSEWLAPLKRPVVVIHGGSASAPFLAALSAPNRVVITATASGDEVNYARFGERFAENIGNRAADIDQDGQTSLLEAFLSAAQQVRTFYTEAGRMASEHPLLDDNGDKLGVSPDWFRGTRVVKRPENSQPVDGFRARQIVLMDTAAEKALTPGQRLLRDQYEQEISHFVSSRIVDVKPGNSKDSRSIVAGLVIASRVMKNKRGDKMAFPTLDDKSGRLEISVFADTYEEYREHLIKDAVLVVEGDVSLDEYSGGLKMITRKIFSIAQARENYARLVSLQVSHTRVGQDFSERLKAILAPFRDGACKVRMAGSDDWTTYAAGQRFHVGANTHFDIETTDLLDYVCHFG